MWPKAPPIPAPRPPPMPDFDAVIETTDAHGRRFWFDAHAVASISRPNEHGLVELHFAGGAVESYYRVHNLNGNAESVLARWARLHAKPRL